MKKFIKVKNEFNGIHCYPNAPEEVKYLRNKHRHRFMVESTVEVYHEDRELEFYIVEDKISNMIEKEMFGESLSCESIATKIAEFIISTFGKQRSVKVEVSEDGRHSAIVSTMEVNL